MNSTVELELNGAPDHRWRNSTFLVQLETLVDAKMDMSTDPLLAVDGKTAVDPNSWTKSSRQNAPLITLRIPPDGRRCNVRQPVYVHTTSYAARGRKRKQKSDDIVLYYLLFLSGYKGRW